MDDLTTDRLRIRPAPRAAVEAIVAGERLSDWAEDYPTEGDRGIAKMLDERGRLGAEGQLALWQHYQVVERESGEAVGGIGFHGPPENGAAEIGYGIVPSRQRRGYATEAVRSLIGAVWERTAVEAVQKVVAHADLGNRASRRVLEKAGFVLAGIDGDDELRRYEIGRPTP